MKNSSASTWMAAGIGSKPAPAVRPCARREIRAALVTLPDWQAQRGRIDRTYLCVDFAAAIRFVNAVARAAEQAGHHPDIEVRWNRVKLTLTTHDAGGLTALDFALAARCDRLAARQSRRRSGPGV